MLVPVLVFLSGFVYESLCVLWNDSADKSSAWRTGICAGALAVCQIFGLGSAIETISGAVAFTLGCAIGGFLAVKLKDRYLSHEEEGL